MRRLQKLDTLGMRIALTALAVALVALATIAGGVLVVGARLFEDLMRASGTSQARAAEMWQHSVVTVLLAAIGAACVLSLALGTFLAWRVSRPLERLGTATRRLAGGDYRTRVARLGPRELDAVGESFNQMVAALESQEQQRMELVANFAHELRTPLTNLRGYLEAMRDGVMDPNAEVFDSLREEVDRLERLSRALDALGGEGLDASMPAEVDVSDAVEAAVELARPGFERAGLRLRLETAGRGLTALAVPDHLRQVLANLLQNAQRYTPAGSLVTVAVIPDGQSVEVSVTNEGTEISSIDLPHVFERFYRVDKSRDRARGGAGIGLAIVKQLVEQAGGRVGAESSLGATRFWFRLPTC